MKKRTKIFIYALVIVAVSACVSAAVAFAADDAFALCKSGEARAFVLTDETEVGECARMLKDGGFIRFPMLFRLYFSLKSPFSSVPKGEYTLSPSMSYDEIRYELFGIGKPREQVRITVPEGYTTDQIIELFVDNGIGTRAGFENAIAHGEFGFEFISLIPSESGRKYRLDGYLFPDTYMFYADSSEEEVIGRMLDNFERKFTSAMMAEAAKRGSTVDRIVVLASMVQSEAYYLSDMAGIASVFENRLAGGMKYLQSDATGLYGEAYDTYKHGGLPIGPICNPGYAALEAAVYPANTKYYYFFTGKDKKAVFSRSYAEHRRRLSGR